MQQPNCQDARNQKEILEIDCPECGEKGGIIVVKEIIRLLRKSIKNLDC